MIFPGGMKHRIALAMALAAAASPGCDAVAAEPAIAVHKTTPAGQEVIVRGFAEFNNDCTLRHVQTVMVVKPPAGGKVETRPGDVVVGPNWVGGGHCEGTTLRGVNVFYVPAAGFVGTDRFSLDVGYSAGRWVRADVEVVVR